MKRPVAVFGLAFFACMFIALNMPAVVLYALAGVFGLGFLLSLAFWRRVFKGALCLVLAAATLAFGFKAAYDAIAITPVQSMARDNATIVARVLHTQPGYGDDTVDALLEVISLDGKDSGGFSVMAYGLPQVQVGELVSAEFKLSLPGTPSRVMRALADGYTLSARAVSQLEVLGYSNNLLTGVRRLQQYAANEILSKLPLRLSGVVAAMAVGEKSYIQDETLRAYRMAGLSHMLVVSGLHISILCGWLLWLQQKRPKHRRALGIAGILLITFFMFFTGFTASVVRSGVVWLMVFVSWLFSRKADIFTSMGLASFLLIMQNPYAAADIGLLLSFCAALGAVLGGTAQNHLNTRWQVQKRKMPVRMVFSLFGIVLVTVFVHIATLPVLIWAGMGFSLLSLPANIIALPLLPVIVLCGFVLIIPASLPVIGFVSSIAAVIGGGLLVLLENIAEFCAGCTWAWVPLGGMFSLIVVAIVYLLVFSAYKTKKYAVFTIITTVTLVAAFIMHSTLSFGTVRIVAAGTGQNASLVMIYENSAAVLYRSRQSLWYVQDVLAQNRVQNCEFLVDMRMGTLSREYDVLEPENVITTQNQLMGNAVLAPGENIELTLVRQGDGTIACIDIAGYKVCAYTGSVSLQGYAQPNVILAGSGTVTGSYEALLVGATIPTWASDEAQLIINDEGAIIWVRPNKGLRISEVVYGR